MHKIILLGAPGSGKGTQAEFLTKALNIPVISTGEIFRAEMAAATDLGKQIKERMDSGQLIADDLTNQVLKNHLAKIDLAKGFILDGYPRTIAQAEFLGELVEITVALNIDVDDDLVIKRMTARRTCSQCGVNFNVLSKPTRQEGICDECGGKLYTRADAKPEAIAERLRIYHQQIDPILDYYRRAGTLVEVDGRPTITEVWEEVKQKLSL